MTSDGTLDGKVVLVVGAGSGIGAAVAAHAAAAGARVAVSGRRREALEKVAAATGATVHPADATVREEVAALIAAVDQGTVPLRLPAQPARVTLGSDPRQ